LHSFGEEVKWENDSPKRISNSIPSLKEA
jgi:hypothetical protein